MATWGYRLAQTTGKRQHLPKNLRVRGPRALKLYCKQGRPSNDKYLNNIRQTPEDSVEDGALDFIYDMGITPAAGATVPATHTVSGLGAPPNTQVNLWYMDTSEMVATTTSDGTGAWSFVNVKAKRPNSTCTWQARCGFHRTLATKINVTN